MRKSMVIALLASVMLASMAAAKTPAGKKPPQAPAEEVMLSPAHESNRTALIENLRNRITGYKTIRDNWCARANEACVTGFDDLIANREKEIAALDKVKAFWDAGDNQQAKWWLHYYGALTAADTVFYNTLLEEFLPKGAYKEAKN